MNLPTKKYFVSVLIEADDPYPTDENTITLTMRTAESDKEVVRTWTAPGLEEAIACGRRALRMVEVGMKEDVPQVFSIPLGEVLSAVTGKKPTDEVPNVRN